MKTKNWNKKTVRKIIILLISIPFLSSCASQKNNEAYCFSVVFEYSNNSPLATLYCKTQKDTESTDMKSIILKYTGDDFSSALMESSKGDYNIYFNSICAYYLSDSLNKKDILELSLELLDNAEYKTDNYILSNTKVSELKMHEYAKQTCENECIKKSSISAYSPTLEFLRKNVR